MSKYLQTQTVKLIAAKSSAHYYFLSTTHFHHRSNYLRSGNFTAPQPRCDCLSLIQIPFHRMFFTDNFIDLRFITYLDSLVDIKFCLHIIVFDIPCLPTIITSSCLFLYTEPFPLLRLKPKNFQQNAKIWLQCVKRTSH